MSPWSLTWGDENYYMLGFDGSSGIVKHYRVDKMQNITLLNGPRDGEEVFKDYMPGVLSRY